jgi:riboflavin kinase
MTLSGVVASGKGEGAFFTRTEWARRRFVDLFAIDPYPGTLNVIVEEEAARSAWRRVKAAKGQILEPPDAGWCDAKCYKVTVSGVVRGAVVLPEVAGYPADQIEIVAAIGLRERLGLADGDRVTLEIEV